jgi:predicted transcriptional regulator
LLGSQLTNDEVNAIADELANQSKPKSADAIRKAIAQVTDHHQPTDADVNRVKGRRRAAAGRWPGRPWSTGPISDRAMRARAAGRVG